jgi:hypothetical protein
VTAAAGRTGTVERAAACEAGRHHLCRGTIVADRRPRRSLRLRLPRGRPVVTSRWSAWGSRATPLRVNVLARDESIAFRCPPRQEPVINLTSRMCRRSPTDR